MAHDTPEETPWSPLTLRERVYLRLVQFVTWVFRVDFFDVYRRQDVRYDEYDEIHRIGMEPVSTLKDEWLHVYQRQSEFYDENDDDEWVPYAMWLVMRSDETINPPVVLTGERQSDGSWEHEVNDGPEESVKERRKREILHSVDQRGFIDPVLRNSQQDDE